MKLLFLSVILLCRRSRAFSPTTFPHKLSSSFRNTMTVNAESSKAEVVLVGCGGALKIDALVARINDNLRTIFSFFIKSLYYDVLTSLLFLLMVQLQIEVWDGITVYSWSKISKFEIQFKQLCNKKK